MKITNYFRPFKSIPKIPPQKPSSKGPKRRTPTLSGMLYKTGGVELCATELIFAAPTAEVLL